MNIFVYGTLRPGQYNDHRTGLSALALSVIRNVTTNGVMHNRHGDRPYYPVVNFDGEGTIVGDILIGVPERHQQVRQTHAMEIGAGYEMREIDIEHNGFTYRCIAYHFSPDENGRQDIGCAIPDGDWLAFCG